MALILDQDGAVVLNNTTIEGAPALTISGSNVTFTNGATGYVESIASGIPAIEITGINTLVVNEDGGQIAEDRVDLPQAVSALEQHGGGSLSTATFDADLAAALDDVLDPNSAVLFTADAGDLTGELFLIVDADGDGAYQANFDYVIHLESPAGAAPVAPDFFV